MGFTPDIRLLYLDFLKLLCYNGSIGKFCRNNIKEVRKMRSMRTESPVIPEVKKLFKWSFKIRGTHGSLPVTEKLRQEIENLSTGESLDIEADRGIYAFGQPSRLFDGGWRGTSDVISVRRVTADTLEIRTTRNSSFLADLSDYKS